MKKLFTILMLTIGLASTAQTTTPYYKNIKLSTIPIGTKNDSIVVWNGTTKLLKHLPMSQVATPAVGLQEVLNVGTYAVSADGISSVRLLSELGEQASGTEFRSSSINGTNIVAIDANSTYMYSGLGESYAFITLSGGNIVMNHANGSGSTGLEFTEPISNSTLRFPAPATNSIYNLPISVNGNLANAQGEITIPESPFEKIPLVEGAGFGIVLKGRNPAFYGFVGTEAVDLSYSSSPSTSYGATGAYSFAANREVMASGYGAAAFGNDNIASGQLAFVTGSFCVSSGVNSFTGGGESVATRDNGFSFGYKCTSTGLASVAFGHSNFARSRGEMSVGYCGTDYIATLNPAILTDRAFNVGIGLNEYDRKDGFTVLKSGLATLPNATNAIIDADLTGKAVITKEYFIDNSGGSVYTVATLPAGLLNDMAIVTDATNPTYLGTLIGGGSVACPVWYNGTNWVAR